MKTPTTTLEYLVFANLMGMDVSLTCRNTFWRCEFTEPSREHAGEPCSDIHQAVKSAYVTWIRNGARPAYRKAYRDVALERDLNRP